MPWKPLPDDVPLDHEALAVADVAAAPDPAAEPGAPPPAPEPAPDNLTELPPGAVLDNEEPAQPPAITAGPTKAVNATPTETVQGFADTMPADVTYHSGLTDADKKEYETLFADPKKPPTPEFLRKWVHDKTGNYLSNADDIVAFFKKTGQYNLSESFTFPTESQDATTAGGKHLANSLLGDFGAEISAPFGALGLGSGDRPDVWNSDAGFGQLTAQNADITRAQLERDTAEHPIASTVGEFGGILAAAPVGGAVADLARVGKLGEIGASAAKATAGGAIYGSGAAGPGHRLEGAAVGGLAAPVLAVGLKLPTAGYRAVSSVFQGAPGTARRIIAKAIADDANTPASVGSDIAAAHANDVPMSLADTGENVRGLLAGATRASGRGRTVATDALETRQAELADRVVGHIERDLGPIANPHEIADQVMTKAHNDAAPLYEKFYSQPSVADPAIDALVSRPSMQKALKNAYRIAQEEGRDPEALGFRLDDAGNVQLERGATLTQREAQRANPNRFAPADIPDEFDELRVRTITTPNGKQVKFRGPIDMTQRLRMMGGIQDQGGELAHLGISNAPRKLDFGKNEHFLGKLVNNEKGMTLDDATHALWEDGYFPEFTERPTPNDLLERLREEHLGTARYFDPQDAAEVDAFHAARADRFARDAAATEAADAGRAPLAEDATVPAGEADAVARAGPAVPGRQPIVEKTYTPQTLDYIKRGMDDVVESYKDPTTGKYNFDTEGKAVNNTLRSFLDLADKRYPDWKAAREAYGGQIKGVAAMNLGRKFVGMQADDIEARMRGMSPFEKEMAALGARRQMAEIVRSKGDTADVVHALVGTGKKRAMLARLFGDRKGFQRFVDTLSQEREGFRTMQRALGGSATARNLQDDHAVEMLSTVGEMVAHGGLPVATGVRKVTKFLGRQLSEKVQQQLAAVLSNPDPAALRKLAAELQKRTVRQGRRAKVGRAVRHGLARSAAPVYAQQSQ